MDIIDLRDKKTIEEERGAVFMPAPPRPGGVKRATNFIWELIKIVAISLAIIIPIRVFVVQPFIVEGASMAPNFHDGEYLIVDELSYRFFSPQRGEVVIFRPPQNHTVYYIKRVIGLPGETVEIKEGGIYIYNAEHPTGIKLNELGYEIANQISSSQLEKITLNADEYFLMGDNRTNSLDSRSFGPVKFDYLKGRAWIRAFPFSRVNIFETPVYNF